MLSMKSGKSYIIWMPENGSGKSRQFIIGPGYLLALLIVLAVCVLLIPMFQGHIQKLNQKITYLENKDIKMQAEIASLNYLKQNLKRIENKDRQLSEYFGFNENRDTPDELLGKGGTSDIPDTSVNRKSTGPFSGTDNLSIHLETLESKFKNYAKLLKTKEDILDHTPSILPVEKKRHHHIIRVRLESESFFKKERVSRCA